MEKPRQVGNLLGMCKGFYSFLLSLLKTKKKSFLLCILSRVFKKTLAGDQLFSLHIIHNRFYNITSCAHHTCKLTGKEVDII